MSVNPEALVIGVAVGVIVGALVFVGQLWLLSRTDRRRWPE